MCGVFGFNIEKSYSIKKATIVGYQSFERVVLKGP